MPYFRALSGRYAGGALFLLVTNGLALLIPWLMKLAVEGLQHPGQARFTAGQYGLAIALVAAVHSGSRICSRVLMLNAARIIEFRIREDLFRCLTILDQTFYSRMRSGDILSRFSNDLTNVRMLSGFGTMSAMNTLMVYLAAVTLMLRINPLLTLWAVLPLPLMVLTVKKISGRLFQRSLQAQEELARLTSVVEESVSAVRLIKSYCREEYFQELFGRSAQQYLQHNLRLARLRGLVIPVMAVATGSGTLVVLFLGGRDVISGVMSLGDFVAFSGYLAMLVWPTAVMGWILTLAQRGAASMSRLAAILSSRPEVADYPDAQELDSVQQGIEFRGVTYRSGDTVLLNEVSFRVAAGERIGITGEVGSGKSTLLRLLPRLLPLADGMILIDGRDINRISLESLRRLVGYVPQEAFLFSRTIRENVAYGADQKDEELIQRAAGRAGLNEDLSRISEGLDALVGERGVMLSGGQKQRLAIARALAADPRILLLDDPLSAVDAAREEEILDELGRFFGDRTVLVVSQRISAFRNCSRVIVLKEGRIAEQGAPADLLEQGGVYAHMAQMQRLKSELS